VAKGSNGGRVQLGYVSKLAGATGAVMWTQGNSSSGVYYFVTGVSADPSGNVVAVGDFQGTSNTSGTTYMIAKLSGTDGTIQWQQAPVTFSRYGYQNLTYTQVSLDSQGDIFLGGMDASSGYTGCGKTLVYCCVLHLRRNFSPIRPFSLRISADFCCCFAPGGRFTGIQAHFGPIGPAIQSEPVSSCASGYAP